MLQEEAPLVPVYRKGVRPLRVVCNRTVIAGQTSTSNPWKPEFFLYNFIFWRNREHLVIRNKIGFQKGVCFRDGLNCMETHLLNEPVLKRLKDPFDVAFGLGRSRVDDSDLLHDPFKLGQRMGILQLFIHRRLAGRFIGGMPVQIDRVRDSKSLDELQRTVQDRENTLIFVKAQRVAVASSTKAMRQNS